MEKFTGDQNITGIAKNATSRVNDKLNFGAEATGNALSKVFQESQIADVSSIDSANSIWQYPEELQGNLGLFASDLFFAFAGIDGNDFRKIYPYSFSLTIAKKTYEIFLPLPPSAFSMDIPSASQLTVTLNGIVEESNGAPLRNISISGSTGIVNQASTIFNEQSSAASSEPWYKTAADYAIRYGGLGNTVGGIQNVVQTGTNAIQNISRALGLGGINFYPLNSQDDKIKKRTGFYWFHSLLRFFEIYLLLKKSAGGKNVVLGFNMYKDKQFFQVTLGNFRWQKIPGSIEYNYSISITAWKKLAASPTDLQEPFTIASMPASSKFDLFSTIRQTISSLRQTVLSLQNLVSCANQDLYENIIGPINEIMLLSKDATGLSKTATDFIDQFKNGSFSSSISGHVKNNWSTFKSVIDETNKNNFNYGSYSDNSSALSNELNKTSASNKSQENILPKDIEKNPYKYWKIFDLIDMDEVDLDQKARSAINAKVDKVRQTNIYTFKEHKKSVTIFSKKVSSLILQNKKINLNDVALSNSINTLLITLDTLINYYRNQPKSSLNDYYSYYIDYAVANGIALNKSTSKFFVPFPTETTLESLSYQYLGNSGRWLEIAALNGLKSPYIDEEGFYLILKSNGNQNTVLLDSRENLYVGQVVEILSNTEVSKKLKIKEITEFSKTEFLISFDGDLDLSAYKLIDEAKIHAYLPNTVNSQMLIAIPSSQQPVNNDQVNLGPGLDQLNSIAQLSKIDFLLSSSGDLVLQPNGNIARAIGLTNLSQAAKMKLFTYQGSMLHRANFGNPLKDGISISDFNAKNYLSQINQLFAQDERFTGILVSNLQVKGPAVDLTLLVGTKNTNVNLPVTTTVPINSV